MGIAGESVADELGVNLRAATLGVLVSLEHHDARALTHHEAVPVAVIWAGRALRRVVERRRQRAAGDEPGHSDPRDRRLGASRHHDLRVAERHQSGGVADGVRSGRTGGHHRVVGSLEAVRDRHISRREIDQPTRNEERRDAPRPPLLQHQRGLGNAGETADPGAGHHPGADLLCAGRGLPGGIVERLVRRPHGKDDEVVDLPLLLRLHPLVGIEAAVRAVPARNLAGDLRRQIGYVEGLDPSCPAVALDEPLPRRLDAASERRHHAESRDDDASHLRLHRARSVKVEAAFASERDRRERRPGGRAISRLGPPAHPRRRYHTLPATRSAKAKVRSHNLRGPPEISGRQLFAFFSRNLMASPTVKIVSAASSGISQPNSSSNAMTSSTVSRLSAPRSSMKLAFSVTFSASTPKCSTTIFFTRSPMSLIAATSCPFDLRSIGQRPRAIAVWACVVSGVGSSGRERTPGNDWNLMPPQPNRSSVTILQKPWPARPRRIAGPRGTSDNAAQIIAIPPLTWSVWPVT